MQNILILQGEEDVQTTIDQALLLERASDAVKHSLPVVGVIIIIVNRPEVYLFDLIISYEPSFLKTLLSNM